MALRIATHPDRKPLQKAPGDVTSLLNAWSSGDRTALEPAISAVLHDLQSLAHSFMARQNPGHTLQPSALVNEAYLRLLRGKAEAWKSRKQFLSYAATTMRRILINHARDRSTVKQGGGASPVSLQDVPEAARDWSAGRPNPWLDDAELLDLDRALKKLSAVDARQARIVELRYFVGMTNVEVARALGVSPRTVKRDWHSARLWLLRFLSGDS